MAVSQAVAKTSINISRISNSVFNTNKSLDGAGKSALKINKTLFKKNQTTKQNIATDKLLFSRRRENVRRREQESIIESSGLGGAVRRQGKIISESTKGFLGRMMDFVGTLLVGWLLNNLPTIIGLAQELIARIQKLVEIFNTFITTTGTIFKTFKSSLGAIFTDISKFDLTFTNTRAQFETSMFELEDAFSQLKSSFDDAVKVFTDPLGTKTEEGEQQGTYSGENIPSPGSTWGGGAPSGGGFSGSGATKGAQIAKRLQKDLGLTDYQAAAVVGNLLNESSQLNPAQVQNGGSGLLKVDGKTGYGWAQWTFPSRQRELYQLAQSMGIDPSRQPLTDEINYAMLVRELPRYDKNGRFRSSRNLQEASNWLLTQYFKPEDRGPGEQRERIEDSQKVLQLVKSSPSESQPPKTPTAPPAPQSPQTSSDEYFKPLPKGSYKGGEGQRFGASRDGGTRKHLGLDITESNWKPGSDPRIPVVAIRGGVVSSKDYVAGEKYLSGLVIDQDDGYSVRYLHMSPSVKRGQKVSAGQKIGRLVNLGDKTHLHIELYSGSKLLDPTKYITTIEKGGVPKLSSSTQTEPKPSPAQVSAASQQKRQQLPNQISQERRGPTVVVSPQAPAQIPSSAGQYSGGGSGGVETIVLDPLNRYITQKLLLELAYT